MSNEISDVERKELEVLRARAEHRRRYQRERYARIQRGYLQFVQAQSSHPKPSDAE